MRCWYSLWWLRSVRNLYGLLFALYGMHFSLAGSGGTVFSHILHFVRFLWLLIVKYYDSLTLIGSVGKTGPLFCVSGARIHLLHVTKIA